MRANHVREVYYVSRWTLSGRGQHLCGVAAGIKRASIVSLNATNTKGPITLSNHLLIHYPQEINNSLIESPVN